MNIAKDLIARVEAYRKDNKNPCKNYATEAKAEAVAAKLAQDYANYFAIGETQHACRYVVVFNEAWGRWIVGFDFTELLARRTSTGGYVGIAAQNGFYTF